MKTLAKVVAVVCLMVVVALPGRAAWNPFKGRPAYVISVIALGVAHACDFQTTEAALALPGTYEANPIAAAVVGNRKNFIAFKIGAGAVPVVAELLYLRKHPQYLPVFTVANWGIAGSVGAIAAHNRSLVESRTPLPPLVPRVGTRSAPLPPLPRMDVPR